MHYFYRKIAKTPVAFAPRPPIATDGWGLWHPTLSH